MSTLNDIQLGRLILKRELEADLQKVGPASVDTSLGDWVVPVIDNQIHPGNLEQVLAMPKYSINDGFELKTGYQYLVPINESINTLEETHCFFSPKSSLGRLFITQRLLSERSSTMNECLNDSGEMYLAIQPNVFNIVIYPGDSTGQLRLDERPIETVSDSDLLKTFPDSEISLGQILHLDLSSGLYKARSNPMPIDLGSLNHYLRDDYFELSTDGIIEPNCHYLCASQEVLDVPSTMNAELQAYNEVGIQGPVHFAGFIDPGFQGQLVFEIQSREQRSFQSFDGMPIGKLRYFPNVKPQKDYSEGHTYNLQRGVVFSKYFK